MQAKLIWLNKSLSFEHDLKKKKTYHAIYFITYSILYCSFRENIHMI